MVGASSPFTPVTQLWIIHITDFYTSFASFSIIHPSIYPSTFGSRGQQTERRSPDFSHPSHFFQLIPRDIISPVIPGSASGFLLVHTQNTLSRRRPAGILDWLLLMWRSRNLLYSDSLSNDRILTLSLRKVSANLRKKLISAAFTTAFFLSLLRAHDHRRV